MSQESNTAEGISASAAASSGSPQLVYAIGTLGYDFGTEARRDSFKQLMPPVAVDGTLVPSNPYDARQMVDYLDHHLSEASALIWTLNLEMTPIYALQPTGPYAQDLYRQFQAFLAGESAVESDEKRIERISVPGKLTGRSVKLFSGQVIPVVQLEHTRGLYGWQTNALLRNALAAVQNAGTAESEADIRQSLTGFLGRVYYDLRNLGVQSRDRALNFSATNAFQAAQTFSAAVAAGMELDTIEVERSPMGRVDSDCWDVKLKFFDPENTRRARKVFRFSIDVSDIVPVTLGEVRSWSSAV